MKFFLLFLFVLFLMSCDNGSTDADVDNRASSSSYYDLSSSSRDSLEYIEPPRLSGREYNPDFNAIMEYIAFPLYNDGKWLMARYNSVKVGPRSTYSDYERHFVFFVSRDDMKTWEKADSLRCNDYRDIRWAFVWNGRFYYVFRDAVDSTRKFFFNSEDGIHWDSTAVVGLPAESRNAVLGNANFYVANNKVFAMNITPCYVTSDLETWQEMKLQGGENACGNNVAWGEPGYRMSGGHGVILYSDDGVIWDSVSTNGSLNGYEIAYGNGVFVRATYNGRDALQWSRDGFEWNSVNYVNSNYSSIFYNGVVFEGGIFLAYGGGMMRGSRSFLLASVNGQDWVEQDKVAYRDILRIVYGNGRYVASIYGEDYFAVFQKDP